MDQNIDLEAMNKFLLENLRSMQAEFRKSESRMKSEIEELKISKQHDQETIKNMESKIKQLEQQNQSLLKLFESANYKGLEQLLKESI